MTPKHPCMTRRRILTILAGSTAIRLVAPHALQAQVLTPNIGCARMQDAINEAKRQLETLDLWVDGHRRAQLTDVKARLPEVKRMLQRSDRELALADHDQFFNWSGLALSSAVLVCTVFDAAIAGLLGISVVALGAGVFLGSLFVGLGLLLWNLATRPSVDNRPIPEYVTLHEADKAAFAFANAPKGTLGASEKLIKNFGRYFNFVVALWNVNNVYGGNSTVAEKEQAVVQVKKELAGYEEDLERLSDPVTFRQATRDNLEGLISTLEGLFPLACGSGVPPLR